MVRTEGHGRAAKHVPTTALREAFELLLPLCRLIDEGSERVVFFADEAGSWQLDVDWRAMLSAYFGCLALVTAGVNSRAKWTGASRSSPSTTGLGWWRRRCGWGTRSSGRG